MNWKEIAVALLTDGAGLAGVGLVSYGTWQIYHPAGLIVFGAFLFAGSWRFSARTP